MAKYLNLWRKNPMAPWPTDPAEAAKLNEMLWAAVDNSMKTGEIKEFGFFLDGTSGYTIVEGEPADALKGSASFCPFVEHVEMLEIVPYETEKEILRGVMKAKVEAMKK